MSLIYETLYKKIISLIPNIEKLEPGNGIKLKSKGFMDLCVDILDRTQDKTIVALAHYYNQNGDMVPDPDMEIALYPNRKMAEALSFQDTFGYRQVYPEAGKVDVRAQKDLNKFLNTWLRNLKMQGHQIENTDKNSDLQR